MKKQKQAETKLVEKPIQPPKAIPQQTLTLAQKAKNILATVQQKLLQDLDHQSITIPPNPIPFKGALDQTELKKQQRLRLEKVIKQKEKVKKKLLAIQSTEKILQQEIAISAFRDRRTLSVRPRSELSPHDISKLKELKRQHQNFQKQLEERTRAFEQNRAKEREQQKQLEQKHMMETNEKKKLEIKKRLEELSQRSRQRLEKNQQDKRELIKIKMKKKLHLDFMEKWEKREKEFQQERIKQYQERKKQQKIDLSELKEHEQKYEEIMKKNRDQMSKKRIQASRVSNKLFKNRLHQSKFYTLIVEEEQKQRHRDQERKEVIIDLVEKRKEFAESVKKNLVPKMKMKSQQNEEGSRLEVKKIPFDYEETRKKGLEYLEQSKSKTNKLKQRQKQRSFEESVITEITGRSPHKYHDYLTQKRKQRNQGDDRSLRLERDYRIEVQEAKNIMKKTSFSERQKIERVKMLAQRMEFDPKTTKSSTLLKKIQAKIQILEALQ